MREIKFRVWDNLKKCWIKGKRIFSEPDNNGIYLKQHPQGHTFLQYTGLKDKNNKEIYEGDVVEYFIKYNDGQVRYKCINEVKFNKGSFFPIPVNNLIDGDEWYSTYYEDYRIIGNIFENPELLEK